MGLMKLLPRILKKAPHTLGREYDAKNAAEKIVRRAGPLTKDSLEKSLGKRWPGGWTR